MNKRVTPRQLELTAEMTREEMLIEALPPDIDPENPASKADAEKVAKIEIKEAAPAVLTAAGPPRPEVEFDDFDWKTDPSIVLQEQRATAVYHNPYGSMVIRQQRTWDEESDPYVVIGPDNLVTFMEVLAKRARE